MDIQYCPKCGDEMKRIEPSSSCSRYREIYHCSKDGTMKEIIDDHIDARSGPQVIYYYQSIDRDDSSCYD